MRTNVVAKIMVEQSNRSELRKELKTYLVAVGQLNMFNAQDVQNMVHIVQQHMQQHLHHNLQQRLQHNLQHQVVVQHFGNSEPKPKAATPQARVNAKATATALALQDRDAPMQIEDVGRRRNLQIDDRSVAVEEDGSPNGGRRLD